MRVRIEIYAKGSKYTAAIEITAHTDDLSLLEGVLLDNGLSFRVTPLEDNENW